MTKNRSVLTALALAAPLLTLAPAASAQSQGMAGEDDPVVARVDGMEVHRSEVFAFASTLPAQYQSQIMQIYPMLVQRLVDFKLAAKAGNDAGLADSAEVKKRMAELKERVIREVWFQKQIDAKVTDEALQARYKEFVKENPPKKETHARHILLETEEQARDLIAKLDEGADFEELAKEHSTGPSGAQGGDLGYFTDDQMVPEFAAAAKQLQPGEYSKEPTKTQFGWHVIKVEDRRDSAPPSFDEVKDKLHDELARAAVESALAELRQNADVEITPAGTSMMPQGTPETAPAPEGTTQPAQ
jgi:peptidyl-prolyl cis-trans isomerase C